MCLCVYVYISCVCLYMYALYIRVYIYMYIYIVCVCVCVHARVMDSPNCVICCPLLSIITIVANCQDSTPTNQRRQIVVNMRSCQNVLPCFETF